MPTLSLTQTIDKLKHSPRVRGIFLTGSTIQSIADSSDIDLVVVLDTNTAGLKSTYTTIENHFADIFFFDISFLNRLNAKKTFSGNDFEGMFVTWLMQGKIVYDPDMTLKKLYKHFVRKQPVLTVSKQEQQDYWVKINYNFIANTRYFRSDNPLYHQALELRLLYSVMELITAYFSFRGIPWRGEKAAVEYLQRHDLKYYKTVQTHTSHANLKEKMKSYRELFRQTLHGKYQEWEKNFVVPVSSNDHYDPALIGFWNTINS